MPESSPSELPRGAATVSYDDVAAAAEKLKGIAHRTPALTSRTVDERTGAKVFFKCENFQRMVAAHGKRVGVILSGGNVDLKSLAQLVSLR